MSIKEVNLAWGDPVVVRQALVSILGYEFGSMGGSLEGMGYPTHEGNPKLIEQLKDMAQRQSGHRPKRLVVTAGATGAINAAIYALGAHRTEYLVTGKRYYPIYPAIATLAGLIHIDMDRKKHLYENGAFSESFLTIIDSPSNPDGLVYPFNPVDIWDSSYASKVYGGYPAVCVPESYEIVCGSLGKSTGLAGLRLGWASTDDDLVYDSMVRYVMASNVGMSTSSMAIAEQVLENLDQDRFEILAASYIDSNRETVQKLLTKFSQGGVPIKGMFATLQMGKAERKAMEKAGIKWQLGSSWGEDDSWARLSLGQDRQLTREAIERAIR
jgi:aspartate/methionine/tyrosine aminotransferase